MSIDICCRTDGTVTEPCLDFFKADTLCEQERSAAMAKIVESEFRHIVLFQNGRHMSRKITGLINLNTFDVLRVEINRYDDHGELIEEAAGYMQTSSLIDNENRS